MAVPPWFPLTEAAVVGVVAGAVAVVWRLDDAAGWARRRRARLLLGLPWGTLVGLVGVLGVYLFLQGGLAHWNAPLTIPFRAWSYLYPVGMAVAAFAHGGPGHLLGNLAGALVLGSVAEFAWGHYPTERGSQSFGSFRLNPYARAFLLFPAGMVVVGLATALLSWGPIIGFSGVVFALAGFALVRYPLGAVLGLVAEDLVRLVVAVLRDPVVAAEARPQYVTPWWAGVATQGHLLGLFLGVVAGAVVLDRSERPPLRRLFIGALLAASSLSLWIVWWYRGGEEYVLYQGVGTGLVFGVALLVVLGLRERWGSGLRFSVHRRHLGVLLLVFPVLVVGFAAVPVNLATVADATPPGEGAVLTVGDYRVSYAENVTNEMVSVVNVSVLGETTRVRTSGVIVVSEERHVWTQALSSGRLAFSGHGEVVLGGVGWRESVGVARRGWVAVGNGSTYAVWLRRGTGEWRLAHLAPPVAAEPVVAGHRFALAATESGFVVEARRNGTPVGRVRIPAPNASTDLGGVSVVRENASVFAVSNDTRVRIATEETYEEG